MEGQKEMVILKKEIDRKLLAALQAQNPQGLEDAIHRYSPYVAGVIRRVLGQLGTREDLEELSSDVFVALWKSAGTLREDSNLKLWLGVVARNRALKHLRSLRLELPLDDGLLPADLQQEPSRFWERQEEARQVRQAVLSMEPPDQDIFLRHYFWRQSVDRIAGELGMNPSTVKSRLKRGREKLRNKLKKEDA